MDYTAIDATETTNAFLVEHSTRADLEALAAAIEVAKILFCEGVLVADGKPLDPVMAEAKASFQQAQADAEARSKNRASRITKGDPTSSFVANRKAQLTQWIEEWESRHAQHGVLIALADSAEQVTASTIEQMVLDGAHAEAVIELARLSNKAPRGLSVVSEETRPLVSGVG